LDDYAEVERRYVTLCNSHADVVRELKDLIDGYVESKDLVYSNSAGRAVIPKTRSFQSLCGNVTRQVFGILLRDHLTAGNWIQDKEEIRGKEITVYRRC